MLTTANLLVCIDHKVVSTDHISFFYIGHTWEQATFIGTGRSSYWTGTLIDKHSGGGGGGCFTLERECLLERGMPNQNND